MHHSLACLTLALALLMAVAAPAHAERCNEDSVCEFQVYIENDSFGGGSTDRYYTNGIKMGGGMSATPIVDQLFRQPAGTVLTRLTGLLSDDKYDPRFGLFLGQNIYTPRRITVSTPQPFDRPWAGWLYLGGVAQGMSPDRKQLHTVELDLGVVGPSALGKQVQTEWHKLIGADEPQGWNNQLHDEPGVLLAYLAKHRYGPEDGIQLVPHYGVTLGNVMTLARAGAVVRAGQHMDGFGPDTIEPGGAMLQRVREEDRKTGTTWDWNVFAGFDARLVAHNIFLDGNTWRSSPSVDRRVFVYDLKAGVSMRIAPVHVSVTRVSRSEEFTTSMGGGGHQSFYSINLSWEFN